MQTNVPTKDNVYYFKSQNYAMYHTPFAPREQDIKLELHVLEFQLLTSLLPQPDAREINVKLAQNTSIRLPNLFTCFDKVTRIIVATLLSKKDADSSIATELKSTGSITTRDWYYNRDC